MEIMLLGLLPFLFLLVAASMLVVSQISGFLQFSRYSGRERRNNWIISRFIDQMGVAQVQLARRSRELEELSRRLRLNNEELARLNNLKTKFLSMAVHDVRTPLSSVKGFSEMLGRSPQLGPNEKRFVNYITRASDQINRLMGDLTDLALIEAGKYKLEMATFTLEDFIADITPSINFVAQTKGVQLLAGETPPGVTLNADRFRLGRVLSNLLGNAVKFTPAGGRVELRMRLAGPWITFYVKDTGPGIHPTERKKIFEKFYQSAYMKDAKARAAGWGLGLAISEEIVRSHGGQIGVESPGLGKGSTFWVRIPLIAAKRPRPLAAAKAAAGLLLLLAAAPGARAQTLPLEEKAKYEQALEQRVEGVLRKMLGPHRYKVVVEATVDFTRVEKFESKEGTTTARTVRSLPYLWGDVQDQSGGVQAELLPGVPLPGGGILQSGARPQSYERRNAYATDFLKRLGVTIVLDSSVDAKLGEDVRAIVAEILDVTPARGDTLTIVRSNFMPVWKAVLYEPEMAGLVIKYLLIGFLSLMTLVVVALSLLKLSGAMREMALAQKYTMTMDMAAGGGAAAAAPGEHAETVRVTVRPEQVEVLADMLHKEDPANIALVVEHLEADIKARLMKALPVETADQVLASLGRVRYVEPEVIINLKEEIERRLAGAVGGIFRLVDVLDASDLSERRRLIETISAKDPELGRQLRRRVFLLDSLARLTKEEWSLLASRVTHEEWAMTLADGPAAVADALLASLPEGARNVLGQMIASKPGDAAGRRAAQDKVAKAVAALVAEGRMPDLAGREPERLEMSS